MRRDPENPHAQTALGEAWDQTNPANPNFASVPDPARFSAHPSAAKAEAALRRGVALRPDSESATRSLASHLRDAGELAAADPMLASLIDGLRAQVAGALHIDAGVSFVAEFDTAYKNDASVPQAYDERAELFVCLSLDGARGLIALKRPDEAKRHLDEARLMLDCNSHRQYGGESVR